MSVKNSSLFLFLCRILRNAYSILGGSFGDLFCDMRIIFELNLKERGVDVWVSVDSLTSMKLRLRSKTSIVQSFNNLTMSVLESTSR